MFDYSISFHINCPPTLEIERLYSVIYTGQKRVIKYRDSKEMESMSQPLIQSTKKILLYKYTG